MTPPPGRLPLHRLSLRRRLRLSRRRGLHHCGRHSHPRARRGGHRVIVTRAAATVAAAVLFSIAGKAPAQDRGWYRGGDLPVQKFQASPLVVDLDGDGRREVVIPCFDGKLYVHRHDGSAFPGWPRTMGFGDGTIGSVAAGDVDGDGTPEQVVAGDDISARNAKVEVYRTDGTRWAILSLGTSASGKATPCLIDCLRWSGSAPHPGEEIVIRDGDGRVRVFAWSGGSTFTDRSASPLFETCASDALKDRYGAQPITPSVAAWETTGGAVRIIAPSTDGKVYYWDIASAPGTAQDNWAPSAKMTFETGAGSARFYGSPALADLDGDLVPETVTGATNGAVYVWRSDGAMLDGWPQWTAQGIVSSPAVADLDGDGGLEVLVGSDDGWIYAWRADGTWLPGWPVETRGDVFSSVVAADVDPAPGLEVIAASFDGRLYAVGCAGVNLFGWPKRLDAPLYSSPAVADLHSTGRPSIVAAGSDGRLYVFDLAYRSPVPGAGWPQFRGGPARRGRP